MAGWADLLKQNILGTIGQVGEGVINVNKLAQDPVGRTKEALDIAGSKLDPTSVEGGIETAMNFNPAAAGTLFRMSPEAGMTDELARHLDQMGASYHSTPWGEKVAFLRDKLIPSKAAQESIDALKAEPGIITPEDTTHSFSLRDVYPENEPNIEAVNRLKTAEPENPIFLDAPQDFGKTRVTMYHNPENMSMGSFNPASADIKMNVANATPSKTLSHETGHALERRIAGYSGASPNYVEAFKTLPLEKMYANDPEALEIIKQFGDLHGALPYVHSKGEFLATINSILNHMSPEEVSALSQDYGGLGRAYKEHWDAGRKNKIVDPFNFIDTKTISGTGGNSIKNAMDLVEELRQGGFLKAMEGLKRGKFNK